MYATKDDRIKEILEHAGKLNLSEEVVCKLTAKSFTERQLHAIVRMLREHLPTEYITLAAEREVFLSNEHALIIAYHSDEFSNDFVFECLKNDNVEALKERFEEIDARRQAFQDALLGNRLFRTTEVYYLLKDNENVYIRHEFNWNTYESRLVLCGEKRRLYFSMPSIPLIGGCWSNLVAHRMLMGQMYLQFIFKAAAASLLFLKETNNLNCNTIPCDNCFYAPYLYFLKNEDGSYDLSCPEKNAKKVYMDYLIKEYPEAYQWLLNRPEGKYFYDDFYVTHTPIV